MADKNEEKPWVQELGVVGAPEFNGRLAERYSSKLQGARGIALMAEVLRREPSAYSLHRAGLLTAKRSTWRVQPYSDKPADRQAAEYLESCMDDMSDTWWRAIQFALSSGAFGFADLNIVLKRRLGGAPPGKLPTSLYNDGLVGIRKLSPRRQETVDRWEFDENGGPSAMIQVHPNTGREIPIPIDNLIHFIDGDDRGGWEGLGWLEPGYNIAHMIWNLEVFAGVGWQRSLVGLPVFTYMDAPSPATRSTMETMLKGLVVNAQQYLTLPGYLGEFKLVTVENTNAKSILDHISQLRWEMLMLMLGTYLRLGSTVSGSRSLAFPLIEMFKTGVNGQLDLIAETLNRHLVPKLFKANGSSFANLEQFPKFDHSTVLELPDEIISNLLNIQGFLTNAQYPEDRDWLRNHLSMPVFGKEEEPEETTDKQEAPTDPPEKGQDELPDQSKEETADKAGLMDRTSTSTIVLQAAERLMNVAN